MKMDMNMMRAKIAAMPAMRNSPQKLFKPRLLEETKVLESGQLACFLKYASSISFIFSLSVTFKIALETSGTSGECNGKTCKSLKKKKIQADYIEN